MNNIYQSFIQPYVTGGNPQPMGTVYNPELAAMDNFNRTYTIQKNFVKNNNEVYDLQNLQKATEELGQFPMTVFTFPNQNILVDTVNWQSPSFMSLKNTVHWLINKTQLSEGMGVLSLLSTMFVASCGKVRIKVDEDWQENASLYVLGISRSGTKKSTLIKRLRVPFEDFERTKANQVSDETIQMIRQEYKNINKKQIRKFAKTHCCCTQDLLLMAKKIDQNQEQVDTVLFSPKLFISDTTSIGFLKTLDENKGVINILDAEPIALRNFIKDPKILNLLLYGHTDEPFSYSHAYKERKFKSLCINICILCQPGEAQKFLEDKNLSDRGLLGRFLPIFSNQTWKNEYGTLDLGERYRSIIQSLLRYFSSKGHIIEFSISKEAQNLLQNISVENTQKIEPYNSFMGKITGLFIRLALAIHLWDFQYDNDSFEISLAELQDAITIVSAYVLPNVQFLYGKYNLSVYKMGYRILQRLYDISEPEHYKINEGILVSTLKKVLHKNGTDLDIPLELLSNHNFIRVMKTQNGADKIIVHPRFYQEFSYVASQFPKLE